MSYDRLRAELLAARERREARLGEWHRSLASTLVLVSTAIPGPQKAPPGASELVAQSIEALRRLSGAVRLLESAEDVLGPHAVLLMPWPALRVKQACVALEDAEPSARLLDLDVYDAAGRAIGRTALGFPARRCLLCDHPAVECMRVARHRTQEVVTHAHRLLRTRAASAA